MISFYSKGFLSRYASLLLLLLLFTLLPDILSTTTSADLVSTEIKSPFSLLNHLLDPLSVPLMVMMTFVLSYLAVKRNFTGMNSTLTPALWLLVAGIWPHWSDQGALVLMLLLLLTGLWSASAIPHTGKPQVSALNAGIYIGLAAIIYLPALTLVLLLFTNLFIHRINHWRSYIATLLGVLTPLMAVLLYEYTRDNLTPSVDNLVKWLTPSAGVILPNSISHIIMMLIILLSGILLIMRTIERSGERSINLRRNLLVQVFLFLFIVAIWLFYQPPVQFLLLAGIPVSLMGATYLESLRKSRWQERLLWLVLLYGVILHLIPLIHVA